MPESPALPPRLNRTSSLGEAMTYNFDPDLWLENQQRVLEHRLSSGALNQAAYEAALEELDRRYEEMVARLDGTYTMPDPPG
jgi:hypothetical protein